VRGAAVAPLRPALSIRQTRRGYCWTDSLVTGRWNAWWCSPGTLIFGRLLVREGEHLLDELVDRPVVVRPRRLDAEEGLEEGALARKLRASALYVKRKRW
jgi:hypothetical protein